MTKVSFTTKSGQKVNFTTKSKGTKKNKSKGTTSAKLGNPTATAKTSKKRKAANVGTKIYNKAEKAIGASAIAKRIMDLVNVPEPYNSTVTTIVGAGRGGIEGGIASLLINSRFIEMALGGTQGAAQGFQQGFRDAI